MDVVQGSSSLTSGEDAVREATASWPEAVDMIFVFHSSRQDAAEVSSALARRFPKARIAGCTTAGEHLSGQHYDGALVVAGITSPGTRWSVTVADNLTHFDLGTAVAVRDRLILDLGIAAADLNPSRHFCISFFDGLSKSEETVSAAMAEALMGIPLAGGSAGDDLQFKRTRVIADGKAYDGAAVFVFADCSDGFRIIKHQHFASTQRYLAVTKLADDDPRRVLELDGLPAATAYAHALGLTRETFSADTSFAHPLIFECNGEKYVRSAHRVDPDGSIAFLCAVEEGAVLCVGDHLDMGEALEADLRALPIKASLLLACNCILRAVEAGKQGKHQELGALMQRVSDCVVGFDTYGEQLNGLHINQTVVGIAIGVSP